MKTTNFPDHPFEFREKKDYTIEQVNRVYEINRKALEDKNNCTIEFLDMAFIIRNILTAGLLLIELTYHCLLTHTQLHLQMTAIIRELKLYKSIGCLQQQNFTTTL